ncbi:MAG: glycosyltransferase family 39 protein, partial [bacterium]|nr:glycosyltransferase family 39 protein [bacterium]
MARKGVWFQAVLVGVVLIAGALAVGYRLTAPTFWVDEAYARFQGLGSVRGVLRSGDPHVASSHLYHLINRACESLVRDIALGNRLPQAVAAWVSLLFVYLLGRLCFSPGAGVMAVLLLITHPFFVRYAQENRMQQMISAGMLASYYSSVRYLYTRQLGWLVGYVVGTAVLVRCGYGVLPMVILGVLWAAIYVQQRGGEHPVEGRTMLECFAGMVVVIALWLPYPLWFLTEAYERGIAASLTRGVSALDVFWEGPARLLPQAIFEYCHRAFVDGLPWQIALVLFIVALVGSLRYRRGTAWGIVAFGLLVTIVSFHMMNEARGGTVPRRYVYLCPLTMVMLGGGMAMTVALFTEACQAGMRRVTRSPGVHERIRLFMPVVGWVAVSVCVALPLVCDHAYQLSQYYFTDRHVYRTMAHVLDMCAGPGARVISIDTDVRDWVLREYAASQTWRLTGIYTTRSYAGKPATFCEELLRREVAVTSEVWLTQVDLSAYGIPREQYVVVPCGESWLSLIHI